MIDLGGMPLEVLEALSEWERGAWSYLFGAADNEQVSTLQPAAVYRCCH